MPRVLQYQGTQNGEQTWYIRSRWYEQTMKEVPAVTRRQAEEILKQSLYQRSPKLTGRLSRRWKVRFLVTKGRIRLRNRQKYTWYQDNKTRNAGFIMRSWTYARPIIRGLFEGSISGPTLVQRAFAPGRDFVPQPRQTLYRPVFRQSRQLERLFRGI